VRSRLDGGTPHVSIDIFARPRRAVKTFRRPRDRSYVLGVLVIATHWCCRGRPGGDDRTSNYDASGMATLVFADGHELPVTEAKAGVLERIGDAQRGGSDVSGWVELTTAGDAVEVSVQVALIAYVRG
jgi:hypothetical protein